MPPLHMLAWAASSCSSMAFDELALRTTWATAPPSTSTPCCRPSLPWLAGQGGADQPHAALLSDVQLGQELAQATCTVLGDRLAHLPIGIGRLPPFDRGQIRTFLRNWLKNDAEADERLRLIDDVKDLLGLSTNPACRALSPPRPRRPIWAARDGRGEVTAASLYQALLQRWHAASERTDLGRVPIDQGVAARFQAPTQLAPAPVGKRPIAPPTPPIWGADAQRHLHDLTLAEAAHEVGARPAVTRCPRAASPSSTSRSSSGLVARAAAAELRCAGTCPNCSASGSLRPALRVLPGHAGADPAATWAEESSIQRRRAGPNAPP